MEASVQLRTTAAQLLYPHGKCPPLPDGLALQQVSMTGKGKFLARNEIPIIQPVAIHFTD